jgi:hypothetical protein
VSWDALAAIAELLGALGVLASLVYLGLQIRQNTRWLRQQAFQLGTNEVRRWVAHFPESRETSELFLRGQRDFHGLDPVERLQFTMLVFEICSIWGTYQQYEGDEFLGLRESAERSIGTWIDQGWFADWYQRAEFMFTPEFKRFCEDQLARHDGGAAGR